MFKAEFSSLFHPTLASSQMNCCGAQEYKDWTNTTFSKPNDAVPDSCCLSDVEGCGKDILTMSDEQAREDVALIRTVKVEK